ncbi:hypothetical protein [Salibacterium halotolerans]|uniref:UDP-N-acetylmuramyl pentapeptide phosphotransferase/UDP-N-acetylglucosamine-1-phosphate transferase n=1 Tax=Salibacterium halotolerans TaxID=1884432 RepID=A0A1I5NQA6_9BACI|nr:hypothetical protein [Salibacterium halotolerans]SFP23995.1 hypothetical protein SAMN05518683_103238 [Salibacterium halotolerans]
MFEEIRTIILCSAVIFLYWAAVSRLFRWMEWNVSNYRGRTVTFSAGAFLLLFVWLYTLYGRTPEAGVFFVYTGAVWTAGWIDDIKGSTYPKGIQGHLRLIKNKKRLTTGVVKIVITLPASAWAAVYAGEQAAGIAAAFLLFVLSPHVCNLLDTRPLRVWKWSACHAALFLFFIKEGGGVPLSAAGLALIGGAAWAVLEGTERTLLGDNGAAAAGAAMAWAAVFILPLFVQWFIIIVYALLTVLSEYFSFHHAITRIPLLAGLDQAGRKK